MDDLLDGLLDGLFDDPDLFDGPGAGTGGHGDAGSADDGDATDEGDDEEDGDAWSTTHVSSSGRRRDRRERGRDPVSHVCQSCGEEYRTNPAYDIPTCEQCGGVKVVAADEAED